MQPIHKMRKPINRGQGGFTMLELMVVVTILGVLAAVLIPKISVSKSKGTLLYTTVADLGKALIHFKTDTACYPTKLAALHDKTQANSSFCGIDLTDNWKEPYLGKATFTSSGDLAIGEIVTDATVTILQEASSTGGVVWKLRATGIPSDILKDAAKACNGTNTQVGKCTTAPGSTTGTLDFVFDETT